MYPIVQTIICKAQTLLDRYGSKDGVQSASIEGFGHIANSYGRHMVIRSTVYKVSLELHPELGLNGKYIAPEILLQVVAFLETFEQELARRHQELESLGAAG